MATQGKLKVTEENNIVIVSFLDVAFLDETSIKELGDELEGVVNKKPGIHLVINFSNIDYLSSAVLGRLAKIHKLVKKNGGLLKLCSIKNNILQVFKITKLDKIFEIHPDQSKAIASFKPASGGFKFWKK